MVKMQQIAIMIRSASNEDKNILMSEQESGQQQSLHQQLMVATTTASDCSGSTAMTADQQLQHLNYNPQMQLIKQEVSAERQRDETRNDQSRQEQQQQQQQQQPRQQEQNNYNNNNDSNGDGNSNNNNNCGKPKRNPFCSRCRNHGKTAKVKGHKRHCEYRSCQCTGCKLVECRQIVSAAQIKRRRYQKQDEECGRRIEVSPPVLVRELPNDTAALIAKTLIGSTVEQAANAAAAAHYHQHQHHQHHYHQQLHSRSHLPGSSLIQTNFSAASSSSSSCSFGQPHSSLTAGQTRGNTCTTINAPSNHVQLLEGLNLNLNVQGGGGGSATSSGGGGGGGRAAAGLSAGPSLIGSPALNSALQLFQFPGQMGTGTSSAVTTSGLLQHRPTLPTMQVQLMSPDYREQALMVEEIVQDFGPLAIYAWLRSEDFDLRKVRSSVEMSRVAYEEMLQMSGYSPLDLTSPIVD